MIQFQTSPDKLPKPTGQTPKTKVFRYTFNISNERFATLTGRSLSVFKRDFKSIFNDTPSHWLVMKRLEEARFLTEKVGRKPKDFYLDLGFESLSHFSAAYKKKFGHAPSKYAARLNIPLNEING